MNNRTPRGLVTFPGLLQNFLSERIETRVSFPKWQQITPGKCLEDEKEDVNKGMMIPIITCSEGRKKLGQRGKKKMFAQR